MNIERLIALRDRVAQTKWCDYDADVFPPGSFNMAAYYRYADLYTSCLTPACLAGHTVDMFADLEDLNTPPILYQAKDLLELTDRQANHLFGPNGFNWPKLTPEQAVRAIDRLIANHEADEKELWS